MNKLLKSTENLRNYLIVINIQHSDEILCQQANRWVFSSRWNWSGL